MSHLINRTGEVNRNNRGSLMEIIEYKNHDNILVRFEQGYVTKTTYQDFRRGKVKNVFDKTIYGVGFLGQGKYTTVENGERTPQYITWKSMLTRCYSDKFLERNPAYVGCKVVDSWHNFQDFAEWYDQNYYEIDGETMSLDKDILRKNNKVYSPENCVFVPKTINNLFTKSKSKRGNFPVGVYFSKSNKKYISGCNDGNKTKIILGYHDCPEEAFAAYKECKERLLKEFAEKFKEKIPDKLYNAMKSYEVEIED